MEIKIMKTKAMSIAVVSTAMMLGSVSPSYADHKSYPASECERWNENYDPATYLSWSRRYNPSRTRRLRLDCPITKDRFHNIRSSWIRVIDRNPRDNVCARIAAFRQLGNSAVTRVGPARCTSIPGNSPNAVHLNTGGLGGIWNDMHYYMSVYKVPTRYNNRDSGVVTYYVDEWSGHD